MKLYREVTEQKDWGKLNYEQISLLISVIANI